MGLGPPLHDPPQYLSLLIIVTQQPSISFQMRADVVKTITTEFLYVEITYYYFCSPDKLTTPRAGRTVFTGLFFDNTFVHCPEIAITTSKTTNGIFLTSLNSLNWFKLKQGQTSTFTHVKIGIWNTFSAKFSSRPVRTSTMSSTKYNRTRRQTKIYFKWMQCGEVLYKGYSTPHWVNFADLERNQSQCPEKRQRLVFIKWVHWIENQWTDGQFDLWKKKL